MKLTSLWYINVNQHSVLNEINLFETTERTNRIYVVQTPTKNLELV